MDENFAKRNFTLPFSGVAVSRTKTIKKPPIPGWFFVLNTLFWRSPTLPYTSTIGSGGLNCRVRNENGCGPTDKPPEQNIQSNLNLRII